MRAAHITSPRSRDASILILAVFAVLAANPLAQSKLHGSSSL
jgi:hypothetical protein